MWSFRIQRCGAISFINSVSQRIFYRSHTGCQTNMAKVLVRSASDDERMQINFSFGLPGKKEKSYNLNRLKTEELGRALERISMGVSKYIASKNKKQNKSKKKQTTSEEETTEEALVTIGLFNKDIEVDKSLANIDAWKEGSLLRVGGCEYTVRCNPPTVLSLDLPQWLMAGFPIFPKYELEFSDISDCVFVWSRAVGKNITPEAAAQSDFSKRNKHGNNEQGVLAYEVVGRGLYYTPKTEDIGCMLKLACVPRKGDDVGDTVEVSTEKAVDAGPGVCPFEDRHAYTMKSSEKSSIRVVCYNVLANYYADSDYSRTVLFPQCPPYALSIDYRKQLFLKEILGYNADLICLQEMDKKIFHSDLSPALQLKGYHSLIKQKAGQVPEGCAMFYRDSKFRMLSQHDIDFSDALANDPLYEDILAKVCQSEALKTIILAKGTTLQVAVLEFLEEPRKKLVVMNTHFYFHPRSAHIRLIHAAMATRHMQYVCEMYSDQESGSPGVVFCGDFNSTPITGVYKYFTQSTVPANHPDWSADGGEEYFGGLDIQHNYKTLSSACGTPSFTNFTAGFQDCLDYIFIDSDQLETEQVVPLPSEKVVRQHIALPNIVFPSDHLALVCDLKWKGTK